MYKTQKQEALDFLDTLPHNKSKPFMVVRKHILAINNNHPALVLQRIVSIFKQCIAAIELDIHKITVMNEKHYVNEQKMQERLTLTAFLKNQKKKINYFILPKQALYVISMVEEQCPKNKDTFLVPLRRLQNEIKKISYYEPGLKEKMLVSFQDILEKYTSSLKYLEMLNDSAELTALDDDKLALIQFLNNAIQRLREFTYQIILIDKKVSTNNTKTALSTGFIIAGLNCSTKTRRTNKRVINIQPFSPNSTINNINSVTISSLPADILKRIIPMLDTGALINISRLSKVFLTYKAYCTQTLFATLMQRINAAVSHQNPLILLNRTETKNLELSTVAESISDDGTCVVGDVDGNLILLTPDNHTILIAAHISNNRKIATVIVLNEKNIVTVSEFGTMRFWQLNNKQLTKTTELNIVYSKEYRVYDVVTESREIHQTDDTGKTLDYQKTVEICCLSSSKDRSFLRVVVVTIDDRGHIHYKIMNGKCNCGSVVSHIIGKSWESKSAWMVFTEYYNHFQEKNVGKSIEYVQCSENIINDSFGYDSPVIYFNKRDASSLLMNAVKLGTCIVWISWYDMGLFNISNELPKSKKISNEDLMQLGLPYTVSHFILSWNCANKSARQFVQLLNEPDTFILAQDTQIKIYRFQKEPNNNEDYFILISSMQTRSTIKGLSKMPGGNLLITCKNHGVNILLFNELQQTYQIEQQTDGHALDSSQEDNQLNNINNELNSNSSSHSRY